MKICITCGAKTGGSKYCSDECRDEHKAFMEEERARKHKITHRDRGEK